MPLSSTMSRGPCGLRGPGNWGSDQGLYREDDDLRASLLDQGAVGPLLHHLAVDAADRDELADLRQPGDKGGVLDDAAIDVLEANPVAFSALSHRSSRVIYARAVGWLNG